MWVDALFTSPFRWVSQSISDDMVNIEFWTGCHTAISSAVVPFLGFRAVSRMGNATLGFTF